MAVKKSFADMSPEEAREWAKEAKERLEAKKAREKAYLDRRARRGAYTPTDEAYGADQMLEQELLDFLAMFIQSVP